MSNPPFQPLTLSQEEWKDCTLRGRPAMIAKLKAEVEAWRNRYETMRLEHLDEAANRLEWEEKAHAAEAQAVEQAQAAASLRLELAACESNRVNGNAELIAQRDALRERLEELLIERDRETEVRRKAEAHVRDMQAYMDRMPYPDEYDDMERQLKAAGARAEQAEAALQPFVDTLRDMTEDLEARWDMRHPSTNPGIVTNVRRANQLLAELQRRRSPRATNE